MTHSKILEYYDDIKSIKIVNEALFLIPEFKALKQEERSKGYKSKDERIMKELTYMYLMHDTLSPFLSLSKSDCIKESISVSKMTEKELKDKVFLKAADYYRKLNYNRIKSDIRTEII